MAFRDAPTREYLSRQARTPEAPDPAAQAIPETYAPQRYDRGAARQQAYSWLYDERGLLKRRT